MTRCKNRYEMNDDGTIPDRCHVDWSESIRPSVCKECPYYDREPDLIERAIESARCRIYWLKSTTGNTLAHQKKAKNQQELMEVTIKALEFYLESL